MDHLHARIAALLASEARCCLATVVGGPAAAAGARLLVLEDGNIEGGTGSVALDERLAKLAAGALQQNQSRLVRLEDGTEIFLDVLSAEERLVLCGAGHIAVPLAAFGRRLGFQVTVIDDRPDFANSERFPGCRVIAEDFARALERLPFGPTTYAVVITRGHEHDVDCLAAILRRRTAYVGLIGSRRRVRLVLEVLAGQGHPRARLSEVFTPIGLPIGAESPEEIALSIVAELVCVRRRGAGQARTLRRAVGIDP